MRLKHLNLLFSYKIMISLQKKIFNLKMPLAMRSWTPPRGYVPREQGMGTASSGGRPTDDDVGAGRHPLPASPLLFQELLGSVVVRLVSGRITCPSVAALPPSLEVGIELLVLRRWRRQRHRVLNEVADLGTAHGRMKTQFENVTLN